MGGGGGELSSSDIKALEEKVKKRLAEEGADANQHVFISFAEEDLEEVNLLRGQAKNEKVDLRFDDYSVKEPFDSDQADYIRRKIREKIDRCSVTLVYLSQNAAASRWVNWEIEESLRRGKGVIGVYKGDAAPSKAPHAFLQNKCSMVRWEHAALMAALREADRKR